MSSSSTITYTYVYTDSEPGRVIWGADEELSDGGSPRVIVYGYDGLPMQPIAWPSLDYVPGPEHPPSPVEVPYVPELEYPEYLVPSDDEAPMEDQPLPAHASPVALSPGYVADSDPEEDPEEDHADYSADGGDDDDEPSDDDDDDTGDEDEEPFEDKEDDEEGEEHLALADSPAVPIIDHVPLAEDTEAFETNEAAPTHILSPPLPPPPSSLYLPLHVPTSLPLPLSPLPPLPALLFIPPVDRREDTSKAELPPYKRLCLTALTSRYEVGESLTTAPRPTRGHEANYGFISTMDAKVRRQRAKEVSYGIRDVWVDPAETVEEEALVSREAWAHSIGLSSAVHYELQAYRTHTQMQDYHIASQESPTTGTVIQYAHGRTFATATPATTTATATTPMTDAAIRALIAQGVADALAGQTIQINTNLNDDGSQGSRSGITRPVRPTREMETIFHISNCAVENQVKFATCTLHGVALTWWNSHVKIVGHDAAYEIEIWNLMVNGTDLTSYTQRFQELALMCERMFPEESGVVAKYVGGLPDMIQGNVMSTKPKIIEEAIEMANNPMDQKLCTTLAGLTLLGLVRKGSIVDLYQNVPSATTIIMVRVHQSATSVTRLATWPGIAGVLEMLTLHFKRECPKMKNKNRGNQGGNCNAPAKVYVVGNTGTNPDSNVVTELGSFDVIIGMDWLAKYHAVIVCDEKLVRIPYGNKALIVRGDGSNQGNETRLNIISCTKTQKYMLKGCHVFLAHVTTKETEDKSEEKRLEDVPIVRDFPEVFPEDLPGL
ncbi:hypothetical protein Tco_0770997, partial [Tanacetum coccineum]